MPGKSPKARVKRSRREGTPIMLRETDTGEDTGLSTHAAKKSRQNLREVKPPRRNVSRQSAPGEGKTVRATGQSPRGPGKGGARRDQEKKLDFVDEAQAQAIRSRKIVTRKRPAAAARTATGASVATVDGRKKPPSQMRVKRKGGPKKRLPIHGE